MGKMSIGHIKNFKRVRIYLYLGIKHKKYIIKMFVILIVPTLLT